MGRPRISAGEIGTIHITRLAAGYRARAQARDDGGNLHQLRVVADTEEATRALLLRRAEALSSTAFTGLDSRNTIAEAGVARLEQIRVRAVAGSLSFSTYESYETTLRRLVVPRCGGITLGALTVGRCDRIIQAILLEESVSSARRARAVRGLICRYAVRDDAIPFNPVRDMQRLPLPEKKTSILTPAQIAGIRELMEHRRKTRLTGRARTPGRSSTGSTSCSARRRAWGSASGSASAM